VLTLSSTLMATLSFVWVGTYAVLGLWLSAAIPFAYQLASTASIYTFARTRRYRLFRTSQLWMSLLLPFALQWSLGGFAHQVPKELLDTFKPVVDACVDPFLTPQVNFDLRVIEREGDFVVAAPKRLPRLPHDLDVLLRHRPTSISPGGAVFHAHDPPAESRRSRLPWRECETLRGT
jgi:hypothetical protein